MLHNGLDAKDEKKKKFHTSCLQGIYILKINIDIQTTAKQLISIIMRYVQNKRWQKEEKDQLYLGSEDVFLEKHA